MVEASLQPHQILTEWTLNSKPIPQEEPLQQMSYIGPVCEGGVAQLFQNSIKVQF